ncbi:hypothetical protein BLNAU_9915 [Blattamonas nauphoetae]|uniref:Uncharacterized protein n=1 Tax=Blattamonas nauphoetae TaxID=2049346 RepID=A0ABQ9XUP3_9EUKA|nr:hypothetical protein BLNAU_9915 [Blattamonas nauphoetae]
MSASTALVLSAPLREGFSTLPATFISRSVFVDYAEGEWLVKRQCGEKGKSIESTTSGPHEDVTALTRHAKRSEAGVDHDGTWLVTVVIHPNCRTSNPTKWLNTIVFGTTSPVLPHWGVTRKCGEWKKKQSFLVLSFPVAVAVAERGWLVGVY